MFKGLTFLFNWISEFLWNTLIILRRLELSESRSESDENALASDRLYSKIRARWENGKVRKIDFALIVLFFCAQNWHTYRRLRPNSRYSRRVNFLSGHPSRPRRSGEYSLSRSPVIDLFSTSPYNRGQMSGHPGRIQCLSYVTRACTISNWISYKNCKPKKIKTNLNRDVLIPKRL